MSHVAFEPKAGIVPLQDHRATAVTPGALAHRGVAYALRIVGRDQFGRWLIGEQTVGDVLCQTLWTNLPDARSIPGWANAWPTDHNPQAPALVTPGGGTGVGGVGGGGGDAASGGHLGPPGAIPPGLRPPPSTTPGTGPGALPAGRTRPLVFVKPAPLLGSYLRDSRFGAIPAQMDGTFPVPHDGMLGIAISGTDERSQRTMWFPTDPRLVSVFTTGNPACASLVADLAPGDKIDPTRTARLHSAVIVVKSPTGGLGFAQENILALNYGIARQDGVPGYGAVIGYGAASGGGGGGTTPKPPPSTTPGSNAPPGAQPPPQQPNAPGAGQGGAVVACMAHRPAFGPIELGESSGDQHEFGVDADGHKINSAHVATNAYFFHNREYDAPVEFQARKYPDPAQFPEKHRVHIVYDGTKSHPAVKGSGKGLWRLYGEHPIGAGGGPPPKEPPPPPPGQPPPTTTPPQPPIQPPPSVPGPPPKPPPTTTPSQPNHPQPPRIYTPGGVF